ncbi:MAG: hypothetical protein D3924_11500 [Candidatus Electrothrix sp. AR4]|nr:hypothetical protein [Candidatus Electrothrix sp. AR4]
MPSLSKKDRRALLIGISALLIFFMAQFVFFPFLDQRKRLKRGIKSKENGLAEMREIQGGVNQLSQQNNSLEQRVAERPESFGLFDFLEKKSAEAQVKENISYMKPSDPEGDGEVLQVMVEMKLKAVQLDRLVALLERIESPEKIVELKRISIQVNKKQQGSLDVIMQVVSLVQAKDSGD